MGGVEGYLIVIALIFCFIGKRMAVSASIIVLVSMILNHLLKTLIQNPRPFVSDGSYLDFWAVSPMRAAELSAEFSTPSGHAMAAAAFYGFLVTRTDSIFARGLLLLIPLLIGVSRPVLGVHFFEDIALGWLLGGGIAFLAAQKFDVFWKRWASLGLIGQAGLAVSVSALVWLATLVLTGRSAPDLPTEFVSVLGFLTGVLLASPIEHRKVGYEIKERSLFMGSIRFVLMLGVLILTLLALDVPALILGEPSGIIESLWRYFGYAIVGAVGVFAVPWLLVRLKLATSRSSEKA
ncbi:MAG: phosphatase PAP2 family protein [Pseudomonadota bacterium]